MLQAVDSNIFIYALDGSDDAHQKASALLAELENGRGFVASQLVLTEVLRKPAEVSPDIYELARGFLTNFKKLRFVDINRHVATTAALLLAERGKKLKPFDALHLASALAAGADTFWTNDRQIAACKIKQLNIRLLP